QRKPRSQQTILIGSAARAIRQSGKSGEKNGKTILTVALEAAAKTPNAKLGLAEVPAEIKTKIEERVNGIGANNGYGGPKQAQRPKRIRKAPLFPGLNGF